MEQIDDMIASVVSELFGSDFVIRREQKEAVVSVLCPKDTLVVLVCQVLPRLVNKLRCVRVPVPAHTTIVVLESVSRRATEDRASVLKLDTEGSAPAVSRLFDEVADERGEEPHS